MVQIALLTPVANCAVDCPLALCWVDGGDVQRHPRAIPPND